MAEWGGGSHVKGAEMLIDSFGDLNGYLVSRTVFIEPETERQCYYRSKQFFGLQAKKYETPSTETVLVLFDR